jgi:hypothetical protein
MATIVRAAAATEVTHNNKVIDVKGMTAKYDGVNLDLSGFDNNEMFYARLDNDDVRQLLATPANRKSLEHRLREDYGVSMHRRTHRRRRPRKRRSTGSKNKKASTRRRRRAKTPTKKRTPSIRRTIY